MVALNVILLATLALLWVRKRRSDILNAKGKFFLPNVLSGSHPKSFVNYDSVRSKFSSSGRLSLDDSESVYSEGSSAGLHL